MYMGADQIPVHKRETCGRFATVTLIMLKIRTDGQAGRQADRQTNKQTDRHTYITSHYMTLLYTTLHYFTLHYITLHCHYIGTALALHDTTVHYVTCMRTYIQKAKHTYHQYIYYINFMHYIALHKTLRCVEPFPQVEVASNLGLKIHLAGKC